MVFSFSLRYRFHLLPLLLFFVFLPLRFNFSLLLCASTLLPLFASSVSLLLSPSPPSSHPLFPFVPPLYDSSQLLPFLFYSFPSLLPYLASLTQFFYFLFSFLCPLLSLSLFLSLALSWPEPDLRMLKPQGNQNVSVFY